MPFLFSTIELAAKLAYNVLDKEYETAPENDRLYEFLCELPTDEAKYYEYRDALAWFHYGCLRFRRSFSASICSLFSS